MIYIIRHGQTIWNKKKRKQGRQDSPLTLKGIEQAEIISKLLLKEIDDINEFKIYISPLFRTKQFSSLVCEHIKVDFDKCIEESRLMEHSFGLWEGLTDEEISEKYPGMGEERYSNWWDYIVPMGESYELISKRTSKLLNLFSSEEKLIFITHEMVSKVIRGNYLKLDNEVTLKLTHPQDTIYKLDNNKLIEIK